MRRRKITPIHELPRALTPAERIEEAKQTPIDNVSKPKRLDNEQAINDWIASGSSDLDEAMRISGQHGYDIRNLAQPSLNATIDRLRDISRRIGGVLFERGNNYQTCDDIYNDLIDVVAQVATIVHVRSATIVNAISEVPLDTFITMYNLPRNQRELELGPFYNSDIIVVKFNDL